MKIFKTPLVKKYGKYFESDQIFINKVLNNINYVFIYKSIFIHYFIEIPDIRCTFKWDHTPEGHVFWDKIDKSADEEYKLNLM